MEMILRPKYIVGALVGVAVVVLGSSILAAERLEELVHKAEVKIAEQEAVLLELAVRTDRNEGDSIVNAIIKDCSARSEFDSLLNSIESLTQAELVTLQSYYDGCAPFFAERKAMMVARFEREFEVYKEYISFLESVDTDGADEHNAEAWDELIALEKQRSVGLNDQVRIQRTIIELFIEGRSKNDDAVIAALSEAQSVAERLIVSGTQIDQKREALSNL